jgi:hypothetical protein
VAVRRRCFAGDTALCLMLLAVMFCRREGNKVHYSRNAWVQRCSHGALVVTLVGCLLVLPMGAIIGGCVTLCVTVCR